MSLGRGPVFEPFRHALPWCLSVESLGFGRGSAQSERQAGFGGKRFFGSFLMIVQIVFEDFHGLLPWFSVAFFDCFNGF